MLTPSQSLDAMRRNRYRNGSAAMVPYRKPSVQVQTTKPVESSTALAVRQPDNQIVISAMGTVGGKFELPLSAINPAAMTQPRNLSQSLSSVLRPAGASRWILPSVSAITPQYVESVLRGALAGNHVQAWEMFDLMIDYDPEIASCIGEYIAGVQCKKVVVKAYAEDDEEPTDSAKEKAAVVSACIRNMRPDMANDENAMSGTIRDILFARFHGQSVLEIDWYKKDGQELNTRSFSGGGNIICPRSTYWVHPVCYAWDMNGRLGLRMALESQLRKAVALNPKYTGNIVKDAPYDLVRSMVEPPAWNFITSSPMPSMLMDFPEDKFLIGIDKFKAGTIMGSGSCLRTLAWWWIASMFCGDWLLNYAQLFGIPFRKATCSPSTSEAKKAELRQMMESMGSSGYVLLDSGNTVEFERAASAAGDSPQAFLFHFANEMKRKVILRQTMSGGSNSQGTGVGKGGMETEAQGPKDQCVSAGAMFASSVLNEQLVPYILHVNYGDGGDFEAPTIELVDEEVGNYQDAQTFSLLTKMINVPAGYLHQLFRVPMAIPGEPIAGKDEGVLPTPAGGGFGGEDDQSYDDSQDSSSDQQPVESRNGSRPRFGRQLQASKKHVPPQAVTKALQDTVSPLVSRFDEVSKIQDATVRKAALLKLAKDIPQITKALQKDAALSEAVAAAVMEDK